jgi:hypothetical protein
MESKVWITRHWESSWSHISPGCQCHPPLLHYALPVFTASDKCYPKSYASRASAPSLAAIGSPPICSTHLRQCRLRRINSFEIAENSEQVATASIYSAARSEVSAVRILNACRRRDVATSLSPELEVAMRARDGSVHFIAMAHGRGDACAGDWNVYQCRTVVALAVDHCY